MATATADGTGRGHLTIVYEDAEDGWVTARIEEEPTAISQGRNRAEAYANVLEALHDLKHRPTRAERIAFAFQARVIDRLGSCTRLDT